METFNLKEHLTPFYDSFPEAPRRPVIGVTANFNDGMATMQRAYYQQVADAGGVPVIIPPLDSREAIVNTLDHLDGLLLTGGADINPLWLGEEPISQLHHINATRDLPELLITRLAYNRQIPILGICRGVQTMAVALDGKVAQDIYAARAEEKADAEAEGKKNKKKGLDDTPYGTATLIKHSQDSDRNQPTHSVDIDSDSMLFEIYQQQRIFVNSFHHQAVSDPGPHFRITAKSPDGIIEAIESSEHKLMMGVQWHPECLEQDGLKLFEWLVKSAESFYNAKRLHERVLTLDTHCDTPMLFHEGVKFDQRDSRTQYDMHKMTEGRQDAVIMVAYLPQPKMGEPFSSKVSFDVGTPKEYADLIFDKIEGIVRNNRGNLSIARTPADLYEDKRKRRKSIMLGIENGIALNHDLANVKYFAQRGVVYITLCHNGDNDICDSAVGCNTHNGVSKFGEKVIHEMNRYGLMVDLSHANERSFYDALDMSKTPIVCSHSNCRALCDVPRNLTDDQLRALARKGGVAHVTLYNGFLRKEGQATVLDAIDHLEHAIKIMGIDHVGLGTDFDGGGGIAGLADSSELINFTLALLRRKYNERDIQKIWGGNWVRLMAQVQSLRKM